MEVLTLGGKQFVKASKAAKDLGYATDYVGQLCRSGAVEAHLVGRTWYVNPDTVGAHRVLKKRNARAKAREFARKTIEETRILNIKQNKNKPQNIEIHYEGDYENLLPTVKKISIQSEKRIAPDQETVGTDQEPTYEILNSNKKILMSGKIPVYDVDEETILTDVTILTPKIMRRKPEEKTIKKELLVNPESEEEEEVAIHQGEADNKIPMTFIERLGGSLEVKDAEDREVSEPETLSKGGVRGRQSDALFVALVIIVLFSISSLFLHTKLTYQDAKNLQTIGVDTLWIKKIQQKL